MLFSSCFSYATTYTVNYGECVCTYTVEIILFFPVSPFARKLLSVPNEKCDD